MRIAGEIMDYDHYQDAIARTGLRRPSSPVTCWSWICNYSVTTQFILPLESYGIQKMDQKKVMRLILLNQDLTADGLR